MAWGGSRRDGGLQNIKHFPGPDGRMVVHRRREIGRQPWTEHFQKFVLNAFARIHGGWFSLGWSEFKDVSIHQRGARCMA